ncbi:MAG: hypothetical protein ACK4GJ_02080, partial [bacterium]
VLEIQLARFVSLEKIVILGRYVSLQNKGLFIITMQRSKTQKNTIQFLEEEKYYYVIDDVDYIQNVIFDNNKNIFLLGKLYPRYLNVHQNYINQGVFICKLFSNGKIDKSFGKDGFIKYYGKYFSIKQSNIVIDNYGNMYVLNNFTTTIRQFNVLKYRSDGKLDHTFGKDGIATILELYETYCEDIKLDDNGNIFITGSLEGDAGRYRHMFAAKFKSNGEIDKSFGNNGIIVYNRRSAGKSILVDKKGNVLVAGQCYMDRKSFVTLWKYDKKGSPILSFGKNSVLQENEYNSYAQYLNVDDNNNIYIVYEIFRKKSFNLNKLIIKKYDENGNVVKTFGKDGKIIVDIKNLDDTYSVLFLDDGNILLGQTWKKLMIKLMKFDQNGNLIKSFSNNGVWNYDLYFSGLISSSELESLKKDYKKREKRTRILSIEGIIADQNGNIYILLSLRNKNFAHPRNFIIKVNQ